MPHYKPDFAHTYTRRKRNHDYYAACNYHIILKKAEGSEAFSQIVGDAKITPGLHGCADVKWSPLGRAIANAIHHFPDDFPVIAMYAYCVMPDHVHISLRVKERSKPSSHDFDLCSSGRLLIVSLGLAPKTELTRDICQSMNGLAEEIAKNC